MSRHDSTGTRSYEAHGPDRVQQLYSSLLREHVARSKSLAQDISRVQGHINVLQRHLTEGTLPRFLQQWAPVKVVVTSHGQNLAQELQTKLDTSVQALKLSTLQELLAIRTTELEHLGTLREGVAQELAMQFEDRTKKLAEQVTKIVPFDENALELRKSNWPTLENILKDFHAETQHAVDQIAATNLANVEKKQAAAVVEDLAQESVQMDTDDTNIGKLIDLKIEAALQKIMIDQGKETSKNGSGPSSSKQDKGKHKAGTPGEGGPASKQGKKKAEEKDGKHSSKGQKHPAQRTQKKGPSRS